MLTLCVAVLWLETVWIGEEYRKQGVAGKMLREAKKEIEAEVDACFVVACPRFLMSKEEPAAKGPPQQEQRDNVVRALRTLGFRRILESRYFIHDPDRRHHGQVAMPPSNSILNLAQ